MPKLKTRKGVAKRFKVSKSGKVTYHSGGKSHLSSSKEPERLRKLRRSRSVSGKEQKFLKRMIPYA